MITKKTTSFNTKILFVIFHLFFIKNSYSQDVSPVYNADGLTRLTLGIQKSFYKEADFIRSNTINNANYDLSNSQGFFINYKVLKYRNHSLKAGLFLNSLQQELKYNGNITNTRTGEIWNVNNNPNPFVEKMLQLEYTIDYSYLLKLNKKWFLDLNIGISQERNQSYEVYENYSYFADENLQPYQTPYNSIYFYERKFYRYNYAITASYKTNAGMINAGLKYSKPFEKVASGQYEFDEPGVSPENQSYGFFNFSGNYLSVTLSYTPSKSLFKKKK